MLDTCIDILLDDNINLQILGLAHNQNTVKSAQAMIVPQCEYGALIQIWIYCQKITPPNFLIMEMGTYQKDRSRRNAARKRILGQAAKQDLRHVTSYQLNDYQRILQSIKEKGAYP